jgi:hypothetical protein
MGEKWEMQAALIGKVILTSSRQSAELQPLESSFANFARKRGIDMKVRKNMPDMILLERSAHDALHKTIARQNEEIDALELRIKRLMERS